jgi:hypothetical protein
MRAHKVSWLPAPAEHDFPAAAAYLSLLASPADVVSLAGLLRAAPGTNHHRVCKVYHADEDADIPCRLVSAAGLR